jgi:hypothetical protein
MPSGSNSSVSLPRSRLPASTRSPLKAVRTFSVVCVFKLLSLIPIPSCHLVMDRAARDKPDDVERFLSATKLPGKHVDAVGSRLYVRLIVNPSHSSDRMYSYTDSQWKPSIIPFPLYSFLLTRLFSIPCRRWLFNDMRLLFGLFFSLCRSCLYRWKQMIIRDVP